MTVDYKSVNIEIAREVLRRGEAHLQAMLTVATAADQRAATLCALFTTAAIATFAAVGAAIGMGDAGAPLVYGGLVCGAMLLFAAFWCVRALWPCDFWLAGAHPRLWMTDSCLTGSPAENMLWAAENCQSDIDNNNDALRRSANLVRWGAAFGCGAPVAGILVWLLAYLGF